MCINSNYKTSLNLSYRRKKYKKIFTITLSELLTIPQAKQEVFQSNFVLESYCGVFIKSSRKMILRNPFCTVLCINLFRSE